jgi:hypothetical protein
MGLRKAENNSLQFEGDGKGRRRVPGGLGEFNLSVLQVLWGPAGLTGRFTWAANRRRQAALGSTAVAETEMGN